MVKKVESEKVEPNIALWDLQIQEVEGKSLERKGRDEVNEMLTEGWVLLSVYTLRYKDGDDTWFERPMAILGYPKNPKKIERPKEKEYAATVIH